MNYKYTDEQKLLKERYASFCQKELLPKADLLDKGKESDIRKIIKDNIKKLVSIGYPAMGHDEKFSGTSMDLISQVIAGEEIAKACPSTFLTIKASAEFFGNQLKFFGTEEQKQKYLPRIINGDIIGCLGLYEMGAGSDESNITATAVKKGDTWILNGCKTFITNAPIADVCLILAYNDKDAGADSGITTFIVPLNLPGITIGKSLDMLGYRGALTGEIDIKNCEIPNDAVLGDIGKGFFQTKQMNDYYRLTMSVASLGIATACMEESNKYSKQRMVSGKYLNRYQEIAFRLADMMILTDLSRLMINKAAWEKENNKLDASISINCAKLFASEAATQTANWAIQIHGGVGLIKGTVVERLYRDAKFGEIVQGTSEILRISIAKNILDKYRD